MSDDGLVSGGQQGSQGENLGTKWRRTRNNGIRGKARIYSCLLLASMLWVTLEKDLMPFATELNVDLVQDLRNRGRSSGGSPKSCSHHCSSKSRSAARSVPRCTSCNSAWCPVRSIMAAASRPPSPSHACSSSGYP